VNVLKSARIRVFGFILLLFCGFGFSLPLNFLSLHYSHQEGSLSPDFKPLDQINLPVTSDIGVNYSSYNISRVMNEMTSSVKGNLTVDFYNNDPVNITQIPFHLYLSAMYYDIRPGNTVIINVTSINEPKTELIHQISGNSQILWINLTETLEPYNRTQFMIQFNSTIPDGGYDRSNSYGSDATQSRIFKFAQFYPMPCVYDFKDGWNTDDYLYVGDPFYFDMAYYDIIIEVPSSMKVASTGKLIDKVDLGSKIRYHFDPILPVREFTFSTSKFFTIESELINGVNVSAFYLPKSESLWKSKVLTHANNAITLFNSTFGTYPYSTLNIVEEYTLFGGMEYPNQVYVTEAILSWSAPTIYKNTFFEEVVVHEVCHEWWYNLVGNDQVDQGFLDEGIVCWATNYYGEIYHADWKYFYYRDHLNRVRTYYIQNFLGAKINQSVYDFSDSDTYYHTAYYKTPVVLELLRQMIGLTTFLNGLRTLFNSYEFGIITITELKQAFESSAGTSLDWFFLPWFDNPYLPKYEFYDYQYDDIGKTLTLIIADANKPYNPYDYRQQVRVLVYGDADTLLFDELKWINSTTTLLLGLTSDPRKVRLSYSEFVIVQLDFEGQTYLELSLPPSIPGYNMITLLIIGTCAIFFVVIKHRRRVFNAN
jgi:hypothetical protein